MPELSHRGGASSLPAAPHVLLLSEHTPPHGKVSAAVTESLSSLRTSNNETQQTNETELCPYTRAGSYEPL